MRRRNKKEREKGRRKRKEKGNGKDGGLPSQMAGWLAGK